MAELMQQWSPLTYLEREVEVLRRRVSFLGNLWRERENRNPVHGPVETVVGAPVAKTSQWQLVLVFLAVLWSGCIASLLALCIGVQIGHSL